METFTWAPSHEYREEIGYDVDRTVYTSGAQQRYLNNPDPVIHSFHLTFETRSNEEIQEIVDFLIARKGSFEAFCYTSLFDNTQYTVCLSGAIPPATQTSLLRKIKLVFEVVN